MTGVQELHEQNTEMYLWTIVQLFDVNRAFIVTIGIFAGACALAVYQSRTDDWPISEKIGTTVALGGVAIGLFGSQLTSIDVSPLSLETIGALITLSGILSLHFWKPDEEG